MESDKTVIQRQRLLLGIPGTRLESRFGKQAVVLDLEHEGFFEFVDDLGTLDQHTFNRVFDRLEQASKQTTKQ